MITTMKKIIFSLLVMLSALSQAQNTVSGVVKDTKNIPLIGAYIYINELHKTTISDAYGNYSLENLPNGKLNIEVTYQGYKTLNKTIE